MNGRISITTAGAGSGKTTELTRLMREAIVSEQVRPEAIIAVTFTKAAAAELSERVRQQLYQAQMIDEAKRLDAAFIGTVHGVCQRLLTRFAFDAGISPRVEVLDERTSNAVIGEAIEEVCSPEEIVRMEQLGRLLTQTDQMTKDSLWKLQVKSLIAKAIENGIAPSQLPQMAESSIAELATHLPEPTTDDLDSLFLGAICAAEVLVDLTTDATKATREAWEELRDTKIALERKRLPWSHWCKVTKLSPGQKSRDAFATPKAIAARVEEHPQFRADLADYTRGIFSIAARALHCYRERKEQRGQLDFTDLESRAVSLLDNPLVQETIHEEFDLLLVDEFQDTSPLQLALFLKLADLIGKHSIWVGDVKQAIYGFRGSDPELMNSVVEKIREQGGVNPPLDTNFRSRPELCHWFNRLFAPAFEASHGLPEAEVKLSPRRSNQEELPVPAEVWVLSTGEFNRTNGQPKKPTAEICAQTLAQEIRQLLQRQVRVQDKITETNRPLEMRDIAVLCRTNGHADALAQTLAAQGISVSREGTGLLKTPEVALALACLKRLIDNRDSLATATIIALQGTSTPEQWLEDRLAWIAAEEYDDRRWGLDGTLVEPSLIALEGQRQASSSASPAEALDDALVYGDVFRVATAWGPSEMRASQRRANLEALRALAVEYEGLCDTTHCPATIAGFHLWIGSLEKDPIPVDRTANAIPICTYHGAKGLEWPVVICTELHKSSEARLWNTVRVVEVDQFDPLRPLHGRCLSFWPAPFGRSGNDSGLHNSVAQAPAGVAAEDAARREDLRLLYVGFTRARDQLILECREATGMDWPESVLDPAASHEICSFAGSGSDGTVTILGTPMARRTLIAQEEDERTHVAPGNRYWFPKAEDRHAYPPAYLRPSDSAALDEATIGRLIELGDRLPIQGNCEDVDLGNALHAVFASLLPGRHSESNHLLVAQRLINAHGIGTNVSAEDVVVAVGVLRSAMAEQFGAHQVYVEIPFEHARPCGSRVSGFIDLALETADGWILIDHKSFRGSESQCKEKALGYSGQLACYREAMEAAGKRVLSQWIHFPATGKLVEVSRN